jgi:predicted ester cyclase
MAVPTLYGRDIADLLKPQGERRQPLDGFDADYSDIVDYIIRCTHRIWEQKDLGLIETHYGKDIAIHTPAGPLFGMAGVIGGTARTLSGFPDRTLIGEAVIWAGDERQGYHSSHRITSNATNLGPSEFGPPTGSKVTFTTIADCLCLKNEIIEEWLVRDNSHIALQLGFSPRAIAREQAQRDRDTSEGIAQWRGDKIEAIRAAAATPFPGLSPPDPHGEPAAFVDWYFDALWNHRRFTAVRDVYSPAARWSGPSGRRLFGWGEITGWMAGWIGSFSNARFTVDHVGSVEEPHATDIAVRWSMAGEHDGPALYGAPSRRPVYVLGISHWRVQDGRIVEEQTVIDDIALLRQIEGGL